SALNLRGLTFGNGLFVTVGNAALPLINAALAISSDATTWTCWKSETLSNLHQVAFGKGSFIAVGSSGVILQSPNFANAQLSLRGGINGEVLELFVSGEIGRDYKVQSNNLLGSPSWVDVFSFHTTEPNTRVSLDPPALGNP